MILLPLTDPSSEISVMFTGGLLQLDFMLNFTALLRYCLIVSPSGGGITVQFILGISEMHVEFKHNSLSLS